MTDQIVTLEPDPAWEPFKGIPRGNSAKFHWDDDELLPYTEYDRARDRITIRRLDYQRMIAPPIP